MNHPYNKASLTLNILQEDIDKGIENRNRGDDYEILTDCPVACAMKRQFTANVKALCAGSTLGTIKSHNLITIFSFPQTLCDLIKDFDENTVMKPGKFDLTRFHEEDLL